jgi:uncharacterized protein YgbK (DUF1537 family)
MPMGAEENGLVRPEAGLRIVADDLTGALDSAAPFASPAHPVRIGFSWGVAPVAHRLSISTGSRDLSVDQSESVVEDLMQTLGVTAPPDTLWFKKMDSVLRGHPIRETVTAFRAGNSSHLVFAPAYPGLGRITVDGQHYVIEGEGTALRAVGPPLAAAFQGSGLHTLVCRPGFEAPNTRMPTVFILDAKTQEELDQTVRQLWPLLPPTTLWAGAGGLALALSGGCHRATFPPLALILAGTRHPVTQAQLAHLARHRDQRGLPSPAIFDAARSTGSPQETALNLAARCLSLDPNELSGRSVMVVGGDTLATVLQAVEAEHLISTGEAATGVAVSQIIGGRWSGITLLSKSGGFGAPELLAAL